MARTFSQIKQSIIDIKNTFTSLNVLNSSSQTAIWNLMISTVASAIAVEEQLLDLHKSDVQNILDNNIVGTKNWLLSKTKEFQFDNATQQGGTLIEPGNSNNWSINYATNYDTIITAASIVEADRIITVRTVKSNPFVKLSPTELSALKSYLKRIQIAGQFITCVSLDADRLYIAAEIFYDGTFGETNTITNIKTALETYLSNSDFGGIIKVQEITDAIQKVNGVKDVIIKQMFIRDADTIITSASVTKLIDLVNNNPTLIQNSSTMTAGYAQLENTPTWEFENKVVMTAV